MAGTVPPCSSGELAQSSGSAIIPGQWREDWDLHPRRVMTSRSRHRGHDVTVMPGAFLFPWTWLRKVVQSGAHQKPLQYSAPRAGRRPHHTAGLPARVEAVHPALGGRQRERLGETEGRTGTGKLLMSGSMEISNRQW